VTRRPNAAQPKYLLRVASGGLEVAGLGRLDNALRKLEGDLRDGETLN
jgi:hypothetical protein